MRTPKKWSDNLKRGIITDEMLESALFSVNKRAKNYRDKKREYSHYRYARHDYSGEAEAKMNEMYEKKDRLLSLIPPVCIHLEYQQNRQGDRVEIGDSVDQYLKYIYTGEITHFGSYVRRNRSRYDDWYDDTMTGMTKNMFISLIIQRSRSRRPITCSGCLEAIRSIRQSRFPISEAIRIFLSLPLTGLSRRGRMCLSSAACSLLTR